MSNQVIRIFDSVAASSPIHRLDPRVKLFAVAAMIVIVFLFNQPLVLAAVLLATVVAWGVLVPKPGVASLYSVLGVLAINLLLEGDPPQWLITVPPAAILTELIFIAIYKKTGHYGDTPKTAMLALTLAAPIWWLAIIYFGLEIVFGTPFNVTSRVVTFIGFMIAGPVFGYIGNKIGEGVRPLLTH